jgi:Flp pilus assembly protein TadG
MRLLRDTEGSALVEMTLIVPLMIGLMIGGVDFSMAFASYATIGKSARAAGRYIASLPSSSVVACSDWAKTNAKNLAVYGKISPGAGDAPLISGWTPSQVEIDCSNWPTITVNVQTTYNTIMLSAIIPGAASLTMTTSHTETSIGS